jgi:hypothetical protein
MYNESDPESVVARALRALPADDARPYGWQEFLARRARAASGPRAIGGGALAVAAALALAGIALWVRFDHRPVGTAVTALAPGEVAGGAPAREAARAGAGEAPRAAQRWLESLPREPVIVRVGTRADVLTLEDRIAQVDDLLTASSVRPAQAAHLLALQRERTQLVSSLVQVRYAETLADESR